MKRSLAAMTPSQKAHHTAKWARTMTKWLITRSWKKGARWNLVEFGGRAKCESRGIVDLLAIRKDHRRDGSGLKRGDLFEIVLIQTKGGSAARPTADDVVRLRAVARHYEARAVLLATWKRGEKLELLKLRGTSWTDVAPEDVFA